MQSVKKELLAALAVELEILSPGAGARAAFESPKVAEHGDFACTAAMQLAKALKQNPRELAATLREALLKNESFAKWVGEVDIAGPGFINLRLKPSAKQEVVREVLALGASYGHQSSTGKKMMVEFVSANPTGPLHVGHGRQAALGDAICNLWATQGEQVYREFYYNDAGVQINNLAISTQLRAQGYTPESPEWPKGETANVYNGEYIADIARDFLAKQTVQADDRNFTASGDVQDIDSIRQFAVAYLRREQDLDLKAFEVKFDNYYLESSLYTSGRVESAVNKLMAAGVTYEKDGALWLKSTDYGDDKDRVMRKSDGSYTYFVPDVAYHLAKWERGFTRVVNIQGTDHHGTIARVRAGLQAAGENIPKGYPDYVLHTMVRVIKDGHEIKISKRTGGYVTLRDLITWTNKDAVRFFLLSRKPDTEYTFDIDLAVKRNNDNPVYYVKYAHARIRSVLRQWVQEEIGWPQVEANGQAHLLTLLVDLIKNMAEIQLGHDYKLSDSRFIRDRVVRKVATLLANSKIYCFESDQDFISQVRTIASYIFASIDSNFVNHELHDAIENISFENKHVVKHISKLIDMLEGYRKLEKIYKKMKRLLDREKLLESKLDEVVNKFALPSLRGCSLDALNSVPAQALMLQLAKYPDMLTAAARDFAPHDVTFYLRDLAASYHSYYDAERILVEDESVKKARLALVAATAQVIRNGLAILGVSAPAKM